MTPHIDLHTHTRLNMTRACLLTYTLRTVSLILPLHDCRTCKHNNKKVQPEAHTHICPNVEGPSVNTVFHPHIISLPSLNVLSPQDPTPPSNNKFHHHTTLPKLPASSGTRTVTPSPCHHKQRCEGLEQYVQEEHIHLSVSLSQSTVGSQCHLAVPAVSHDEVI